MADPNLAACNPGCPVPNLKEDVGEIKAGMKTMHDKQDKMIELSVHMVNMKESIEKLEAKDIRDKKNIYERLGNLEKSVVTKDDLYKIIAIVVSIAGLLFTIITVVVNLLLR